MPKDEFDFEDPLELNGRALLTEEDTTDAMCECFIEEFMRMGYTASRIYTLFRNPHYIGMNMVMQNRGEQFVSDAITDLFARWGRSVTWPPQSLTLPQDQLLPHGGADPCPGSQSIALDDQASDPMGAPVPKLNLELPSPILTMSNVLNWQLGREMEYPYEAAYPDHQFAFVFNINRCIGCQSCTMACKSTWTFSRGQENMWWNNVETKPYGGYPQHWDVKILDLLEQADPGGQGWDAKPNGAAAPYGKFLGKTIFEAAKTNVSPEGAQKALGLLPADEEWSAPNRFEDHPTGSEKGVKDQYLKGGEALPQHKTWFFYLARICNHCSYPACLAACPRNAIYKRPEDGIVLIDQERCRGYRKCLEACPYKKSLYRGTTRTSEKCIGCFPRVEGRDQHGAGLPMQTRCMAACIGQIRLQGLIEMNKDGTWKENRQSPLYYLTHVAKVALPLYPQFGTEPNGYYIPPRWVPRPYLKQMFGPGVDAAIERYGAPDRELLAVLQLFGKDHRICFRYEIKEGPKVFETEVRGKKFEMYNDTIIGYAKDGTKIIETTVEEPLHLRPDKHANSI